MSTSTHEAAEPSLPAQRLRELLRRLAEKGISQAQVARRANVTPQYISDARNEHRPLTELFARRLAEEFDVNYQWLLGVDDSPERIVLSSSPVLGQKILLPLIGEPIAGEPREQPQWRGAYVEVSGIAAAKAAHAMQPYVLQLSHIDRGARLRKGDFILVSQQPGKNPELSIVRCGKKMLLARKKGGKWIRAATGEPLREGCDVTGHCIGIVWSPLK
jgi:transcriptional regulator with XRE-family HTH domain